MSHHRWVADDRQPDPDMFRNYSCKKCGAGPVRLEVLEPKNGITRRAKRLGIEPDCNDQQVKEVMSS